MANRLKGEVEIRAGEKVFLARPTFDAICRAEDECGPLFALAKKHDEGELSTRQQVQFLKTFVDGDISEADLGEAILSEGGATQLRTTVYALLAQIITGGREKKAESRQRKSTGATSAK